MVETYVGLVIISFLMMAGFVLLYVIWTVLTEDEDNE